MAKATNLMESGVSKNRGGQKKAIGARDVRYQLKTLESCAIMESDDFFAGDFSKQASQVLVKPAKTQSKTHTADEGGFTEVDTEMTDDTKSSANK